MLGEEPDLRSALNLLDGYERSYNEALRLRLEEANGLATVRLWLEFAEPVPARQSLELATAALHGIVKALLGGAWEPLSVCFSHPKPATLDAYHDCSAPGCSSTTRSPDWSSSPTCSMPRTRCPIPCCGPTRSSSWNRCPRRGG